MVPKSQWLLISVLLYASVDRQSSPRRYWSYALLPGLVAKLIVKKRAWRSIQLSYTLTFLTPRNCEVINVHCFKLLSFRVICFAATENLNREEGHSADRKNTQISAAEPTSTQNTIIVLVSECPELSLSDFPCQLCLPACLCYPFILHNFYFFPFSLPLWEPAGKGKEQGRDICWETNNNEGLLCVKHFAAHFPWLVSFNHLPKPHEAGFTSSIS